MICLDSTMTYSGIHVAVFLQCVKILVSSSPLRLAPCVTSSALSSSFTFLLLRASTCRVGQDLKGKRTSDTLIGYLPIFQMLPKTSLCIRYHWCPFE